MYCDKYLQNDHKINNFVLQTRIRLKCVTMSTQKWGSNKLFWINLSKHANGYYSCITYNFFNLTIFHWIMSSIKLKDHIF